jgi:hypothetical protein
MTSAARLEPADAIGDDRGQDSRLGRSAYLAGRELARLERLLRRLPAAPPALVLGLLVLADWLVAAQIARIASHAGWRYADGGLGSSTYTTAWVLAHGHLPASPVSFGYPLLLAPLTWVTGASLLAGLPALVVLNLVVLSPLALLAVYGLARELAGRSFGYLAAGLWIVLPLLGIRYFLADFHATYVDLTLPTAVGLTPSPEYPALVASLLASFFAYRACLRGRRLDALCAGLAGGLALAVKPSCALLFAPLAAALLLARRPALLGALALGLAPSLVALAVWQYRTSGHVPAFDAWPWAQTHVTGKQVLASLDGFREYGWSQRLVYWFVCGGLVGLARRSWSAALLVGGWLASYLIVVGGDPAVSVKAGTFLPRMLPALPAFFLLAVSTPFLVPVLGRQLGRRSPRPSWPRGGVSARAVTIALAALALLPVALLAALPALTTPRAVALTTDGAYLPFGRFTLGARASGGGVLLRWQPPGGTGATRALILRTAGTGPVCSPVAHAASRCELAARIVATAPPGASSLRLPAPPTRSTYVVALASAPAGAVLEPLLLSTPVTLPRGSSGRR